MADNRCIHGRLDETKYASPMHVIGLYIAAASLVCMFFMLSDIFVGLRHKKSWLPCKLFSLNSVTLTLLSVAAKLPLDLTTPMPSVHDQLSKLIGTALICISMGFFMPSLGITSESECLMNMVALTIFIITIAVNICIQMSTGVIVLFFAEHIVMLCCMFLLLVMLWYVALDISNRKRVSIEKNKAEFTIGRTESLGHRLMWSFVYGYNSNPQLVICKYLISSVVDILCAICSVLVSQVAFRCLVLKEFKFCVGESDYGWSMWAIIIAQILTVIVGSVAISVRWFTMFNYMNVGSILEVDTQDIRHILHSNPILGYDLRESCEAIFKGLVNGVVFLVQILVIFPPLLVFFGVSRITRNYSAYFGFLKRMHCRQPTGILSSNEFDNGIGTLQLYELMSLLLVCYAQFDGWIVDKSVANMKKCVELSKSNSLVHLNKLLSRISPSPQLTIGSGDGVCPDTEEAINVSSLSIVLLVRIAEVSIPTMLSETLVEAFREAYEFISFIDNKLNSGRLDENNKPKLAKAVWVGSGFSILLPKMSDRCNSVGAFGSQTELGRAVSIIKGLKTTLPSDCVKDEVGMTVDYILGRQYTTIKELYDYIEQLFVDMLHVLLAKFPIAIFKDVNDSPAEEYEERTRRSLKLVSKIEMLDDQIRWSFPSGYNITCLGSDEKQSKQSCNETLEGNNVHVSTSPDYDAQGVDNNENNGSASTTTINDHDVIIDLGK